VQGTCLSHLTFLLRQVTHERALSPFAPLCKDFFSSTGVCGAAGDPFEGGA
jgi:hypothetical protein